MSAVADKLREARALIERGWTQDYYATSERNLPHYYDNAGKLTCYCALGAISMAVRGHPDADAHVYELRDLERFVEQAIERNSPAGIAEWNDAQGRTQADVLAAFDRAIELAEQGA